MVRIAPSLPPDQHSQSTTSRPPTKSWDIDTYLNPYIPRPRLHRLPHHLAHFLGYRAQTPQPIPQPLIWFYSFLGAFIGITCAAWIFRTPYLIALTSGGTGKNPLLIIGSLGATAILEYNTITSPLSQPRNAILGQGIAAAIGVAITKLFAYLPPDQFEDLRWLAGALAVGLSSAVMGMTKTIHPPAGATSLLAATSVGVSDLGWLLIPIVMGTSAIMVFVGLIVNNIQRQFPLWWWTELPLTPPSFQNQDEAECIVQRL